MCRPPLDEDGKALALVTDGGAGAVVPARVHAAAVGLALQIGGGDLRLDGIDLTAQLRDGHAAGGAARGHGGRIGAAAGHSGALGQGTSPMV